MPTLADVSDADIDLSERFSKILEGLSEDAFSIARDVGLQRSDTADSPTSFSLSSEEASELFRQGQLITGPPVKQQGEPMLSYIARRKSWWSTLRELDPDIRVAYPSAHALEKAVFQITAPGSGSGSASSRAANQPTMAGAHQTIAPTPKGTGFIAGRDSLPFRSSGQMRGPKKDRFLSLWERSQN